MQIIRNKYDKIIKRELIGLLTFAFIASMIVFSLGVFGVLYMVEKGWIN